MALQKAVPPSLLIGQKSVGVGTLARRGGRGVRGAGGGPRRRASRLPQSPVPAFRTSLRASSKARQGKAASGCPPLADDGATLSDSLSYPTWSEAATDMDSISGPATKGKGRDSTTSPLSFATDWWLAESSLANKRKDFTRPSHAQGAVLRGDQRVRREPTRRGMEGSA